MTDRTIEDFTREATETLAQLNQLLAREDAPEPDHLLRLARDVRDGAARAEASTIARIAQRLEDAAGSYATRAIVWSDELRQIARQTIDDLQILIRALNRWGLEEEARVRSAIARWNELGNRAVTGGLDVVHISALFYDDEGPHVLESPFEGEWAGVVPIESLLLRGEEALGAALALRPRMEPLMEGAEVDPALRGLLEELFDLLRQAADREPVTG